MCFEKWLYGIPYIVFTVHLYSNVFCQFIISHVLLGNLGTGQANEETVVNENTCNLQGC